MKIPSVKGMNDVLPTATGDEAQFHSGIWERVAGVARECFAAYAYDHVQTPVVEEAQLFARAVGDTTDIVGKEMYSFPERGGEKLLCLRPEGTAGAVRAFIEHGLGANDPVQRWWYLGPMFRHERHQKHRYRQFFQIGCEAFGVKEPELDAEVLALCGDILRKLSLTGIELRLNSLGDAACRPAYLEELKGFLSARAEELCGDCRTRLEKNPLRVLDCKNERCKAVTEEAPAIHERLCAPCAEHFARVRLAADRLQIDYRLDKRLVRGLDYYGRTAFEYAASALGSGAQTAVGGGGRYDGLVALLGGPPTPAVGFAMGVERLCALVAQGQGIPLARPDLFLAVADEPGREAVLGVAQGVRAAGGRVEVDFRGGKLQRQLQRADKRGARFAVVLGSAEVSTGLVKIKDMRDGSTVEVAVSSLGAEIVARRGE